jgi:hypothetical protein
MAADQTRVLNCLTWFTSITFPNNAHTGNFFLLNFRSRTKKIYRKDKLKTEANFKISFLGRVENI